MRKTNKKIIVNSFNFKVAAAYKAARKLQKTAQRKEFYVDGFAVSSSEWASAKMEGFDTAVSNASVKGDVPRLVHKRGIDKRGFSYLKGKNYATKSLNDDFEGLVTLDEILEVVPELV